MALVDGGVNFDARRTGTVPRTIPYAKAANSTDLIKKGVPLVKATGADTVGLPAVSGGNSTADKLLGFGVSNDRAASSRELNSAFAMFPGENQPGSGGLEQVLVHVADPTTEFQLSVDPAQAPTLALEGTAIGLKLQANGQWTLDTSYTTHAPCLITKVSPEQIGVAGGFVTFKVPAGNSQYQSGN